MESITSTYSNVRSLGPSGAGGIPLLPTLHEKGNDSIYILIIYGGGSREVIYNSIKKDRIEARRKAGFP